ncbi:uncharacterized protein TRAVEDRAFT_27964 [Trametes versicolor FP-101664 SS1]|uniref:uncharacterized protein n=1 Tax=Trametes versicolor (strain FP-101664) TaxID=717944 RepID=UPI0004623631|nr:uncharacterized protein TRAVEDRAFT_27964 [Trametes versicolor FP-101664 SS1]EIW60357.1 hypothetical protein TRAVEDRAFT_27964 [Trametes versicolor FP-101664 SS1]
MPRTGSSPSGPSGEDAMSLVTSSGGATSPPSEGNATAPSQSEGPQAPMTSTRRQRLTLSYMRPPSTEGGGFPYPDMEAFSDHGGGSEVLPAYSPGPS